MQKLHLVFHWESMLLSPLLKEGLGAALLPLLTHQRMLYLTQQLECLPIQYGFPRYTIGMPSQYVHLARCGVGLLLAGAQVENQWHARAPAHYP